MPKRPMWRAQHGSTTVEALFVLPILFLLFFGGFLYGYFIYVKLVMAYHVQQESERFAKMSYSTGVAFDIYNLAVSQERKRAPGLGSGYQGYSLAVPLDNQYGFAISIGCYPMPFRIPHFSFGRSQTVASQPPPPESLVDGIRQLMAEARQVAQAGSVIASQVQNVLDEAAFVHQMASAFFREKGRRQAIRMVGSLLTEPLMQYMCGGPGQWVVTARAVAWSEHTKVLY